MSQANDERMGSTAPVSLSISAMANLMPKGSKCHTTPTHWILVFQQLGLMKGV